MQQQINYSLHGRAWVGSTVTVFLDLCRPHSSISVMILMTPRMFCCNTRYSHQTTSTRRRQQELLHHCYCTNHNNRRESTRPTQHPQQGVRWWSAWSFYWMMGVELMTRAVAQRLLQWQSHRVTTAMVATNSVIQTSVHRLSFLKERNWRLLMRMMTRRIWEEHTNNNKEFHFHC